MSVTAVYAARWVLPISSPPVEDGAVAVDGSGKITYVGERKRAPAGKVTELGDAALLPGLVNAHTHLELTAMRGFLEDLPFFQWVRRLTAARAAVLTPEMMLDGARLGLAEGIQAGITTYADTSSSGVVLEALREAGVRGIMYQEIFGPDPAKRDDAIAKLQGQLARLRTLETDLVRLGVSPHAVYSVHETLLVDVCALAAAEGLPVAMHVAESEDEMRFLRDGEGPFAALLRARGIAVGRRSHSPIHLLVELGIAQIVHPLLIHAVQLDESDIGFIVEHRCPVAHCPASNAKLGHGVAPVPELLRAGVTVALGTDSVASNNRMHLLDEARTAVMLHRSAGRDGGAMSAQHALELATIGGARALGLDDRIGTLEAGKDADLAAFSLDEASSLPVHDVAAALVFGAPPAASFVAVRGHPLVGDGAALPDTASLSRRVVAHGDLLRAWALENPPDR